MIYLGLGSNLPSKYGNRFDNIDIAVSKLAENNIKIIKRSSFYETPSYPDKSKPKFINIVILVKSKLSVKKLMTLLISIEKNMQRERNKKNDPRTCDIDIIDYNAEIINLDHINLNVSIPHKKMNYRNFVLYPLKEISPKWKHPITNESITDLITKLSIDEKNSILKVKKY